ncbi:unnamed protein product [Spirodela intermedia]|uniref:DUF676 domain-containing protein n=1 Tax=Spirodela intermedia TaxID=51605 RepID=A0A7I8LH55_SPIIN|nr:unnamed protein product [Spirodela intermedia]
MVTAVTPVSTVRWGFAIGGHCRVHHGWRGMGCRLSRGKSSFVLGLMSEGGRAGGKAVFVRLMGSFRDSVTKAQKLQMEHLDDGVEIWGSPTASSQPEEFPEHLVVMVNGIVGSAEDWKYAAEQFVKKLPGKVTVYRSQSNYSILTFDGVDMMGERLAKEVLSVVKRRPGVQRISFVAHSLGGLIARYAVGRLYEPGSPEESSSGEGSSSAEDEYPGGRVAGLEPANFITFATPHLGSRGHKQLPFLGGLPFLERGASQAAHLIVGRTGKHLFLTDDDGGKPPLLLRMVRDGEDIKFRSALTSFKRCVAYANANFDHMVGWRTSSIRRQHELPDPHLLASDERYPHIVFVGRGDVTAGDQGEPSPAGTFQRVDLEEEMIRGLSQVPWERIDVSFKESTQRYIAHTTIQVKSYWMNSDGADVVSHMIDNFLV